MRSNEHYHYQDVKETLNKGFTALRKAGYVARQNFMCCQGCAWAALEEDPPKVVFYHKQDTANLRRSSNVYLAWRGDGDEIVRVLRSCNLDVEWDGSEETRIFVKGTLI